MILEDFIALDFLLESAKDPMTDLPSLMRECSRVIETAQETLVEIQRDKTAKEDEELDKIIGGQDEVETRKPT